MKEKLGRPWVECPCGTSFYDRTVVDALGRSRCPGCGAVWVLRGGELLPALKEERLRQLEQTSAVELFELVTAGLQVAEAIVLAVEVLGRALPAPKWTKRRKAKRGKVA